MIRFRRSPALVLYWSVSRLWCFNPRTGRRLAVAADLVDCLTALDDWTTIDEFASTLGVAGAPVARRLVAAMIDAGVLEVERDGAAWPWTPWSPEASFFFFGTRGGSYPADPRRYDAALRRKAKHDPPPDPLKRVRGRRVPLPPPLDLGPLSTALLERRTWRHFGTAPVTLPQLATLLQMTWGVQHWARVPGQGRVALKTSPSGGARHSIEAYVLVRQVKGLRSGVYHYACADHELVDLRGRVTARVLTRLLVNQFYYRNAGAIVIMSAVFARAMWRYPFNRALRTVFAEAGHLGQTFSITATSLGLAPFTVMAFDEAAAERLIGIDGVGEASLYIVGVGTRAVKHARQPGLILSGGLP